MCWIRCSSSAQSNKSPQKSSYVLLFLERNGDGARGLSESQWERRGSQSQAVLPVALHLWPLSAKIFASAVRRYTALPTCPLAMRACVYESNSRTHSCRRVGDADIALECNPLPNFNFLSPIFVEEALVWQRHLCHRRTAMFFACYCALRTNVKVREKLTNMYMSEQVCGYDNEWECSVCSVSFLRSFKFWFIFGNEHGL